MKVQKSKKLVKISIIGKKPKTSRNISIGLDMRTEAGAGVGKERGIIMTLTKAATVPPSRVFSLK